ncbi:MAG: hypothetical protein MCS20_02255 [Candidatus Phytoplasma mali]|nr:hypothetical protein [Candidatus Phytoplasma australiense]MCG7202211.1 hypothetical protein [Candidatus Phytoplasma mali]MCZ8633053.1 hypothetical protein [Spiroplasma sp. Tabriz.8]
MNLYQTLGILLIYIYIYIYIKKNLVVSKYRIYYFFCNLKERERKSFSTVVNDLG